MINAKRANALLWIGNVLLIVGIVAFAFQFLIFPETRVPDFKQPTSVPPLERLNDPTDTTALARLPNPLLPKLPTTEGDAPRRGPVKLIGTDAIAGDPQAATAYLEITLRRLNVNAYVGEKVRDESAGVEVPELSGWILQSVTPKTAVFKTPEGEQTLHLEEITASSGPVAPGTVQLPPSGAPWDPAKYTSKKNAQRSNESAEAWDIDRKEVEWAAANVDSILQGVSLEPYPGGGLKINSLPETGFASERGFRAGDVIRSVNNQPIENIGKLQEVMSKLSRNARTLTVMLDRSGRIYTLTYTVPPPGR